MLVAPTDTLNQLIILLLPRITNHTTPGVWKRAPVGHLLIYSLRCRSPCVFATYSNCKSRMTKTTGANRIRVVPYEWSACDSPSSSPPLFEPVHQPCADPRPEKDSLCNQSVAPFISCELFRRERGKPQKPPGRLLCSLYNRPGPLWRMGEILTPAGCITGLSVWFSVSDQLSPAVGESQNSQNAMLPNTIWVCQLRAGGHSAVCDELTETMLQSDQ